MTENQNITSTREDIYRLLSAFYYPPTKELIEERCCETLAGLLRTVAPEAAESAADAALAIGDCSMESMAVEYARLFIGPFRLVAPPYGSIYLEDAKTVMGDSTARVAAFYRDCGLQLADDFHELPDHFAVELEFLSFLAFKQRVAMLSGNQGDSIRFKNLQIEFMSRFLLPWLESFTSAVINDGEAPFYQAIARCTAAFINADYTSLCGDNCV